MAIDIGRSIRVARAMTGVTNHEIAEAFGVSKQRASHMAHRKAARTTTIDNLAKLFGMSASEFVALGETEDDDANV